MSTSAGDQIIGRRRPAWLAIDLTRHVSRSVLGMPLLIVTVGIVHLATLLRFIEPQHDDAWFVSRALALIKTGHTFGQVDVGVLDNFEGHSNYFWYVGTLIHSLFVRVLGANLFSVRFTSLLFGLLLLWIIYAIGVRFYSPRVGLLAVLSGAFSLSFIYSSHVGRQDIMVAVFGFGAIALYLYQDNTAFTFKSFLSGLLVGITLDIHPTGIIYWPAIIALLLVDYRLSALRLGRTWAFILGATCGVLYFVTIHILPNPETYFAISRIQQGSYISSPPILSAKLSVLYYSFSNLVSLINLPIFILAISALAILLRRSGRSDRQLTTIFVALFVTLIAVVPVKPIYYGILIAPVIWLILAAGADYLLPQLNWRSSRKTIVRTVVVLEVLFALNITNLPMLVDDHHGDYEAALQLVRQTVPAGKAIIGEQTYWLARPDQPYYVWEQFAYYRRYYPETTVVDAIEGLHPDYVIMDGLSDNFLSDDQGLMYHNDIVPRSEMLAFLSNHTTLVAESRNDTYGDIRVYRINW